MRIQVFPRYVYAIYPYDSEGNFAGVYVGQSEDVEKRITGHIYTSSHSAQDELHQLMKENGFEYEVLDVIRGEYELDIEYKWINHFSTFKGLQVFNARRMEKEILVMDRYRRVHRKRGRGELIFPNLEAELVRIGVKKENDARKGVDLIAAEISNFDEKRKGKVPFTLDDMRMIQKSIKEWTGQELTLDHIFSKK